MNPGSDESFFVVGFLPYAPENGASVLGFTRFLNVGLKSLEDSRIALDLGIPTPSIVFEDAGNISISTRSQEIRVIRIGGQVEAFVDGKRWLYQPVVNENLPFAAYVDVSSADVKIESIQFAELLSR